MALPAILTAKPAPRPHRDAPERHLSPLPRPHSTAQPRSKMVTLAIIAIAVVAGIFTAQLWLSVAISQGAYETNDLLFEERELARAERVMEQEVLLYSSPQNLAKQAVDQGMLQNSQPAFLTLATANIQGELSQTTQTPRNNTVANAALSEFLAPAVPAPKPQKKEPAAATAEKPEKTEVSGTPSKPKPTGPVAWNGKLPAPTLY